MSENLLILLTRRKSINPGSGIRKSLTTDPVNNWKIRIATNEDWREISELSREVSLEGEISDYINEIGPRYLERGEMFVLEADRIIGFQKVEKLPDNSIYLSGLRIGKDHRRKGGASRLIRSVLTKGIAEGRSFARSVVEPDNFWSLSLLSKFGFRKLDLMNFFTGSVDLSGFRLGSEWPDLPVDLGHLWVRPHAGIPAKLYELEGSMVSVSEGNFWTGNPSFTLLNGSEFNFEPGGSLVNVPESLGVRDRTNLAPFENFERAFLLECDLKKF